MEPQTQKEVEALNNEIRILKKLRHERIVSYYGSEHKDGELHLFMEFMAGGSLYGQIKRDGVLSEHLSKWYTKQMLEGVCFLHSHDIIHRDIKGSNVLLDSKGNVKLADFGLSKIIEKVGSKTNLGTFCGTSYWMAPEILLEKGYGRKADTWSLGCTVVEMLTGKPPLGHLNPSAAMFSIGSKPLDLTLPERVSNEAKTFIEAALTWEPDNRPWSHELQNYAFISNRNGMEESSLDLEAASEPSAYRNLPRVHPKLEASEGSLTFSKPEDYLARISEASGRSSSKRPKLEASAGSSKRRPKVEASGRPSWQPLNVEVKTDGPSWDELEELGIEIAAIWKTLGRRLGFGDAELYEIDLVNKGWSKKAYQLLRRWRAQKGSDATYQALYDALTHELVGRRDLAEKYCRY